MKEDRLIELFPWIMVWVAVIYLAYVIDRSRNFLFKLNTDIKILESRLISLEKKTGIRTGID